MPGRTTSVNTTPDDDQKAALIEALFRLSEELPDEYQHLLPEQFRRKSQAEKMAALGPKEPK